MKNVLRGFSIFYQAWKAFIEPIATLTGRHVTANSISVLRIFGAPFVVISTFFGWPMLGFWIFVVSALGDSFDGSVAQARLKLGYQDDPKLGAFIDAFADKMFWISLTTALLPLGKYDHVPSLARTVFLTSCIFLLLIEIVLAVIRVSDYQHERHLSDTRPHARLIKATGAGKIKFILENIGVGGLIVTQRPHNEWAFYVGATALLLAIPFAVRSLREKLRARRASL